MFKKLQFLGLIITLSASSFGSTNQTIFKVDPSDANKYTVSAAKIAQSHEFTDNQALRNCIKLDADRNIKQLNAFLDYINMLKDKNRLRNFFELCGSSGLSKWGIWLACAKSIDSVEEEIESLSDISRGIDEISEESLDGIRNDHRAEVCVQMFINENLNNVNEMDQFIVRDPALSNLMSVTSPYEPYLDKYCAKNGGKIITIKIVD